MFKKILTAAIFMLSITAIGSDFKVGIARKAITPQESPIWMAGYAVRNKPATGICYDLWAKALVVEESEENRIIIVTMDLIGLNKEISEVVAKRLIEKYRINRSQLLLNVSHCHTGPLILPSYTELNFTSPADLQSVVKYSQKLTDNLVEVVDLAMSNMEPMILTTGHGLAYFAKNRRDPKLPVKPVDYDVPVLGVSTPSGILRAILFGYACHNTTLPGEYYEINGDYAGYAQIELEKAYPGIIAMFFQGCGADINPEPRGTVEDAQQNGKSLAEAVQIVLTRQLNPVRPPIRTAFKFVDLEFPPFNLELYQKEILSKDKYAQRRAKLMLEGFNKSWDMSRVHYPAQAIRFNSDLAILALAGEVVVDYALIVKKEYSRENLFVAGYSNDVPCYIPTKRILKEGGYEANSSLMYKGLPGPFAENVEDKVMGVIHQVMKEVGAKISKK